MRAQEEDVIYRFEYFMYRRKVSLRQWQRREKSLRKIANASDECSGPAGNYETRCRCKQKLLFLYKFIKLNLGIYIFAVQLS